MHCATVTAFGAPPFRFRLPLLHLPLLDGRTSLNARSGCFRERLQRCRAFLQLCGQIFTGDLLDLGECGLRAVAIPTLVSKERPLPASWEEQRARILESKASLSV
jgi:hypothetical protein